MKNFSEQELEEINSWLDGELDDAKEYSTSYVVPIVSDRYDAYFAEEGYYKKKFPNLSKTSNLVSTDVADTIEWAMPSLMKLFTSTDNVISIDGTDDADDRSAQVLQKLIEFQLTKKNNNFLITYNWFKDALVTGVGFLKCSWDREIKETESTDIVSQEALTVFQNDPAVEIISIEQVSFDLFKVKYKITTTIKNQPKLENVLASEVLFPSGCKSLEEAPFVAHRLKKTLDHIRRQEIAGFYKKGSADKILENLKEPEEDQLEQQVVADNYTTVTSHKEDAKRDVELYECYTKMDIDDDELLEDVIITKCENTIIKIQENTMGRHPFFAISPVRDPHRIIPKKSYADLIGQLQDLKTALIRQIMTNTALSNDPRAIISEEAINIKDYVSGRAIIRKKAGFNMSDAIQHIPVQPLAPWTFNFLEYIEGQKESRTGITRYNQGLDAKSLNKTASGISSIMNASNQRLELIARMFAETGMRELYRFLVFLDQKFIDQNTVIRLENTTLNINPDDLQGEFDYTVNAGVGMGTKEMTLMNLQTLLTLITQLMAQGLPIATPINIYNILKKYIEELGFKNAQDYITDPTQQLIMQQAMGGMNGQPGQEDSSGGNQSGGQGSGGQGVPPSVPQGLQGTNNQQAQGVSGGGLNPMQGYAPRA